VKRSADTRIRRQVVGQLIDYAANAILHWSVETLQERFVARCAKEGKNAADALAQHMGPDQDAESFWAKVKGQPSGGRVRLLFVADRIPPELRKIVEFLNKQMQPAQVLAIELRQYQGLRALAPIPLGQTKRRSTRSPVRQARNRAASGTRRNYSKNLPRAAGRCGGGGQGAGRLDEGQGRPRGLQ